MNFVSNSINRLRGQNGEFLWVAKDFSDRFYKDMIFVCLIYRSKKVYLCKQSSTQNPLESQNTPENFKFCHQYGQLRFSVRTLNIILLLTLLIIPNCVPKISRSVITWSSSFCCLFRSLSASRMITCRRAISFSMSSNWAELKNIISKHKIYLYSNNYNKSVWKISKLRTRLFRCFQVGKTR